MNRYELDAFQIYINNRYFEGKLPPMRIRVESLSDAVLGRWDTKNNRFRFDEFPAHTHGLFSPEDNTIYLDPETTENKRFAYDALLHEKMHQFIDWWGLTPKSGNPHHNVWWGNTINQMAQKMVYPHRVDPRKLSDDANKWHARAFPVSVRPPGYYEFETPKSVYKTIALASENRNRTVQGNATKSTPRAAISKSQWDASMQDWMQQILTEREQWYAYVRGLIHAGNLPHCWLDDALPEGYTCEIKSSDKPFFNHAGFHEHMRDLIANGEVEVCWLTDDDPRGYVCEHDIDVSWFGEVVSVPGGMMEWQA